MWIRRGLIFQLINLLFTDIGILTPAAIGEELVKLYI